MTEQSNQPDQPKWQIRSINRAGVGSYIVNVQYNGKPPYASGAYFYFGSDELDAYTKAIAEFTRWWGEP